MEATLETKAETILQFVHGLSGSLRVTFEERTAYRDLAGLVKSFLFFTGVRLR